MRTHRNKTAIQHEAIYNSRNTVVKTIQYAATSEEYSKEHENWQGSDTWKKHSCAWKQLLIYLRKTRHNYTHVQFSDIIQKRTA